MPGAEAHGGYAFCGLATLVLIQDFGTFDIDRLAVSNRGNADRRRLDNRIEEKE